MAVLCVTAGTSRQPWASPAELIGPCLSPCNLYLQEIWTGSRSWWVGKFFQAWLCWCPAGEHSCSFLQLPNKAAFACCLQADLGTIWGNILHCAELYQWPGTAEDKPVHFEARSQFWEAVQGRMLTAAGRLGLQYGHCPQHTGIFSPGNSNIQWPNEPLFDGFDFCKGCVSNFFVPCFCAQQSAVSRPAGDQQRWALREHLAAGKLPTLFLSFD